MVTMEEFQEQPDYMQRILPYSAMADMTARASAVFQERALGMWVVEVNNNNNNNNKKKKKKNENGEEYIDQY